MPTSPSQPGIDLARLSPGLGRTCNDYLSQYGVTLARAVADGEPGLAVAERHARILDGLLGALYCAADAAARIKGFVPSGRVALVAVGGYGRGTVGLHSDVDVLFLADDPSDPHIAALAEGLLYPLWDLGLDIGHVVRGVSETASLARSDVRTATTLLDLRRIAGNAEIVEELLTSGRRAVFEPALGAFIDALREDTEARHERFGGSLYLLEPEVKLGRGGLRDLDVLGWAAKARFAGEGPEDWVRTGGLLAREAAELESAREFLWRVRNLLHHRARRAQDRLTFEDQEEIAVSLGFVDGVTLAVEQFMQAYYRHARTVAQSMEHMLERARPPARRAPPPAEPLGDGTMVFDGHVTLEATERLATDPALALRLYRQVLRRDLPPYPFAREAIARAAVDPEFREKLQASDEARQLFRSLLTHVGVAPLRRGSALGALHEVGLLLAMIPEFEPVTGRVQHDVYHVYTVDVHSVAAVDRLRAIFRGDFSTTLPMASRLAAETPRRDPLFLGVLLHDIGKAHGKDHSEKGAVMAGPIATRLGLSPVDVDHVVWLVRDHLALYHWATRRDTSDPQTLEEIATSVGTVERLRDLYLLTVADLSTTNEAAMTSWKARMLEDLYIGVSAVLEGDVPPARGGGEGDSRSVYRGRAAEVRREVEVGFVGDAGADALHAFVREMPDRYILANPVDVIRVHARAFRDRGDRKVSVVLGPGPAEQSSELAIIADDRPGLLADVTAVLAAHRLGVMSAQIYTRLGTDGPARAFDVFYVQRVGRNSGELTEGDRERVEGDLGALLAGEITREKLLARRPAAPTWARRHLPHVPTEVTVDNQASSRFTVVDVYTRDRLGLLHTIAKVLHEERLSIALSKINTEGARAADVFYVVDEDGKKVADAERLRGVRARLLEALERFHREAEASDLSGEGVS